MQIICQNLNNRTWVGQKLKTLSLVFLILCCLNISTGAVIILVSSSVIGELEDDGVSVPPNQIRLLHIELFGGIIHLHSTSNQEVSGPGPLLTASVSAPAYAVNPNSVLPSDSAGKSFSSTTAAKAALKVGVGSQANKVRQDKSSDISGIIPARLNGGLKPVTSNGSAGSVSDIAFVSGPVAHNSMSQFVTSSNSEPGLARASSPNFQATEKSLFQVQLVEMSSNPSPRPAAWPLIYPFPPEVPPKGFVR